jgi:hypothetical protein
VQCVLVNLFHWYYTNFQADNEKPCKEPKSTDVPLQNILNFPMVSNKSSSEVADQPLGFWKIPSVSKVLNVTMPEDARAALDRWQANLVAQLGEQGFQEHKASKFYKKESKILCPIIHFSTTMQICYSGARNSML